jgi:uncharacterized protein YjaZ
MAIFFLNAEFGYSKQTVDTVVLATGGYIDDVILDLKIEHPFDTIIYPNDKYTENDGVGGFAMSGGVLQLRIDLRETKYNLEEVLSNPLKATIYHECNHIARWQGPGYGIGLINSTVSEGIATVYEKLATYPYKIPHGEYQDIEELLSIYRKRNKDDDTTYNHNEWFFGAGERYPAQLGYKVGTYIVEQALEKNKAISIYELTKLKSEDILEMSGVVI